MIDTRTGALDLALQPGHLLVLLPAVGALLALAVRRSTPAALISAVFGLLGLATSGWLVFQAMRGGLRTDLPTIGALPQFDVAMPLRLTVDRLAILVAVAVALVSLVVQLFGRWYLYNDPRYRSFAAAVGLFTAAMQLVVLSGDLLLMLVGWEVMGWCSYLLIGHDSERHKARRAAYKAFLVTRLADAPFVLALVALMFHARSTSISVVLDRFTDVSSATLSVTLVLLVVGVAGKSALVPFQDWLPDAMEGPTPASALIHAATMVAAGTYVVVRLHPLFAQSPTALLVLAVLGSVTTVLAGLFAFGQFDLKRLLAWATVSQMGLMLTALAGLTPTTSPDVVAAHLLAHAGFKALLFLLVGWLSVAVAGTLAQRMSGAVDANPATRRLTAIGLLTLAGVPPFFAFVTKDLMVEEVLRGVGEGRPASMVAAVGLLAAVPLTAAYALRLWTVLTHRTVLERHREYDVIDDSRTIVDVGLVDLLSDTTQVDERGRPVAPDPEPVLEPEATEEDVDVRPPWGTRLGLWGLALSGLAGGVLVLSPWLRIDLEHVNLLIVASGLLVLAAVGTLVKAMSVGTTFGDPAEKLPMGLRSFVSRGGGADTAYVVLVARPVQAAARLVARLDDAMSRAVDTLPSLLRRVGSTSGALHTGAPARSMLAITVGALVLSVLGVALW